MEAGFIILAAALASAVGVVIGVVIGRSSVHKDRTKGVLYVYYDSDNNKQSLLLEPGATLDDIASEKRVMFNVMVIK